MELKSAAFNAGSPIPTKYTREGQDISPPLQWTDAPNGTQEFALLCEDPDAPRPEPWVHWILAKIPGDSNELPEGSAPGVKGSNDFGETGYGGPMPPPGHGTHHYQFNLYALDAPLNVSPGLSKSQLQQAMKGHVLDQTQLVGTYER